MHNHMTIAVEGPEGQSQWKYQERNWWDKEESKEVEEGKINVSDVTEAGGNTERRETDNLR
jgi:hypothetical protein